MITPTYPGVYVQEQASGARAISGVATSVTAFVGTTRRGPMLAPRRIFSPRDFDRIFGTGGSVGELPAQVRLFFDNGGGEAWVTRTALDPELADITLNNEVQAGTLTLSALEAGVDGNTLRAEVDYDTASPEETFNIRIYREVQQPDGSFVEDAVETFTNVSMNPDDNRYVVNEINNVSALAQVDPVGAPQAALHSDSVLIGGLILPSAAGAAADTIRDRLGGAGTYNFQVRYNGGPAIPAQVDIAAGDSITAIRDNIAQGISDALGANGITQVVGSAHLNPAGLRQLQFSMADASFEILPAASNDLAVPLMLTLGTGALYVDRFALNRPAPSGHVSQIHSVRTADNQDIDRLIAFAEHDKADIVAWQIADNSVAGNPGDQPVIYPDPAGTMIQGTRFAPGGGGDTSQGALTNVQENLQAIADAITADANGRWTGAVHGYRIVLQPNFGNADAGETAALTTTVAENLGAAGEIFENADDYNVAAYTFGTNGTGLGGGVFQDRAAATDGFDGLLPGSDEYRAAFDVMEREVDIFNILVLPRARAIDGVQQDDARKVAANLGSAFAAKQRAIILVDPPSTDPATRWNSIARVSNGTTALRTGLETRNAATYWPRLRMADGTFQDTAGPIAGLMARTDGTRGVWKAPAGVEATIRGVAGVETPMSDPENGVVNPDAVNAIRTFPDGVLSWGARTLVGFDGSGNQDDKYVPVRRTMLFIEESLYRGLRFAVFEPNDEPLWAQIRLAAGSFMNSLFRQGAFAGGTASEAYFVNCDATTTTATDINLGIVNVIVGFAPLKPAEFVILTVTQIAGQVEV